MLIQYTLIIYDLKANFLIFSEFNMCFLRNPYFITVMGELFFSNFQNSALFLVIKLFFRKISFNENGETAFFCK